MRCLNIIFIQWAIEPVPWFDIHNVREWPRRISLNRLVFICTDVLLLFYSLMMKQCMRDIERALGSVDRNYNLNKSNNLIQIMFAWRSIYLHLARASTLSTESRNEIVYAFRRFTWPMEICTSNASNRHSCSVFSSDLVSGLRVCVCVFFRLFVCSSSFLYFYLNSFSIYLSWAFAAWTLVKYLLYIWIFTFGLSIVFTKQLQIYIYNVR